MNVKEEFEAFKKDLVVLLEKYPGDWDIIALVVNTDGEATDLEILTALPREVTLEIIQEAGKEMQASLNRIQA